ncbi:MarR family winged helix-turn-helix transcriptional regulator [uncultured Microbacterium sp.]|uniref:MarR family winged helix-turn-helix transcriptional regulator n=1 Tax=uncultured Microbacterium sp. TaxID=191216 RepID=UPI0025F88103|nr:MarR family transcriptional regulator [uncultured Microbacterium sp.]
MTTESTSPPSYWYSESTEDERGSQVMQAMRLYRAAEMTMRRQMQASMAMGENELLVLRFLTRESSRHRDVTPIALARYLGVSTASVTALLDRLERSGHVMRSPHPSDRRKVVVALTQHADDEMRETLAAMHARMMQATRGMSDVETAAVTAFLERMRCAVADVCTQRRGGCCGVASTASPPAEPAPLAPGAAA